MQISARTLPLILLFALLLIPAEANAEQVVITSGFLSHGNPVLQSFPGYNFNFAGANFSARGSDERLGSGTSYSCLPCAPGQTFGTSSVITFFSSSNINFNAATVGGTTYTPIWFNGSRFDFAIEPVVIPLDAPATLILTSAFTFSGSLTGILPPFNTGPIFSMTLSGQGLATLTLSRINLGGSIGYGLTNIRYDFQPAAAVPEPATLLLFGTGLAGAIANLRKRRKASKSQREH